MKYLCLLLNIFFSIIFFNTFSLKIKIGQNIDNFIFNQWETKKEEKYENRTIISEDGSSKKIKEGLFLLLELKKINENKYIAEEYEIVNLKFPQKPQFGKDEKCNFKSFEIDFTNENPKYNLKLNNIEMIEFDEFGEKKLKEKVTNIDLSKNDVFLEKESKKHINDELQESERKKEICEILKNLSKGNFEEKDKKWALFKIKIKDDPSEKFFYCNDIESINNLGGIFDKKVEEITVIKSNCEDIYLMYCFTSQCRFLKKVDLTNLKTKDDIYISSMFLNCKNLNEVIFPKDFKVDNIALLFSGSNNIEKINFEDLKIDNLYSMALLFMDSKMKKIKFPKFKIKKDSQVYINKNGLSHYRYKETGILSNSDLEEIDLSNVEFEKGAGKDMFKKNTVKKIILPENMKNLSEQEIRDIFNDSNVKIIQIGKHILTVQEFDKIELFIKTPEDYLKGREMIKKLYYNEPITNNNNNNIDQNKIKDIQPKTCITCCGQCLSNCCCCKSKT